MQLFCMLLHPKSNKQSIIADFLNFYISAYDVNENSLNVVRWHSEEFPIYSKYCFDLKNYGNDCKVNDLAFGNQTNKISHPSIESKENCSQKCSMQLNCSHYSWDRNDRTCNTLTAKTK